MALSSKEADIAMLLAAQCHLGTKNLHPACERYVHSRRSDGIHVINVAKTWDKLQLAARIIVAIENPADIAVLSSRPFGQRAALKFAHYTGAKALAGRHTPGELIVVVADGESGEGAERERGSEREKEKRRSTQGGCRSLRSAVVAAAESGASRFESSRGVSVHSPPRRGLCWSSRIAIEGRILD